MKKDTFAALLKRTRKERGVTQTEFAKSVGVSSPTVNRWERGAFPRADQIFDVVRWLQIPADRLLKIFAKKA